MKTFDIAVKYLKDIDFSFWDVTKTPEQQSDMTEILKLCYERFEADKNNIVSNEHYRAIVFEVATCHLIDLAHNKPSCFLVACQICSNNQIIFSYDNYEIRGAYPKVMWDEWDKYCSEQTNPPHYLIGELSADIFAIAYEYTFNPEPPRIFIKIKKIISKIFFTPYNALMAMIVTFVWGACSIIIGAFQTDMLLTKLLHTDKQTKETLSLTTSILIWILIILAIVQLV